MAALQEVKPRRPKRQRPKESGGTGKISVVTNRLILDVPAEAFTLAGFRAWATADGFPERVRVGFIRGKVFLDMSNEELETHVAVKTEITRVLTNLNRQVRLGKYYSDGVLVTNEAAGVSNNPDAVFFSREALKTGRVTLVPREGEQGQYVEAVGSPDWVLEVVSASSVQKDTVELRAAYHRAGILEYWLVDARGDQVAFQILHHRKNGYAATAPKGGWQRSRVFGRSFRLERQRDELGLWEDTLHVRDA